ncbi:hypothetical protein [Nocardia araoensis]
MPLLVERIADRKLSRLCP